MDVKEFIHETSWNDLPEDLRRQARRYLLDTLGRESPEAGQGWTQLSMILPAP